MTTRSTATGSGKSDSKSRKSMEKRPSRIERLRSSISEKTGKFSLDRPRFSLPDRSKFHLPERSKFRLPDKSKFHLPDRPKFNIKKPNIRLPDAFTRAKRPSSTQEGQLSTESTAGSRRNIFDFATYPRIFDKKKKRDDYATSSSPKDSRTESAESATFPRARKEKPARWARRFGGDAIYDRPEETAATASDDSPSWHQTSLEEPPRLSARTEEEILAAARAIPWEDTRKREYYDDDEEEIQYMDYEQESSERSDRHPAPPRRTHKARRGRSYEHEETMEVDPIPYGEQKRDHRGDEVVGENDWRADQMPEEKFRPIPRSRSLDEDMRTAVEQEGYDGAFMAVDPRRFVPPRKAASEERRNEMEVEEDEEGEPSSMQSDREQQASSGSSCDRRRRGVIEEIDSDEFFLRASGISQDDVHLGEYLSGKIRDALKSEDINALDDIELPPPTPPQRPMRMRSRRKRKEASAESEDAEVAPPPARPKRERAAARRSREASIEMFRERTRSDSRSDSRHRVVYQTEGEQQEPSQEPLDDIVVVKPARRKARSSSLRSQSQPPIETSVPSTDNLAPDASVPAAPPVVPVRRKRSHRETMMERRNGDVGAPIVCNGGHHKWEAETDESGKPTRPSRSRSRQSLIERLSGRDVALASQEDVRNAQLHRRADSLGPEVAPVPPKRRSRSRGTSVAADEDRTSHGAESLPEEAGYVEEDIPREEENGSMRDLSNGYAMVDKRPPSRRLPPPRRKRKFATLPKPVPPKRPQRAYSTLGPSGKKDIDETSETRISSAHLAPAESAPYIEIDQGDEHRDLRSGEVLHKMQGRPLPAPPRPPRMKKEHTTERPRTPFEFAETTTATQTDPLPDDMVIEEEITQAKLVVTPSRSGSQVLVSMERIPSPSGTSTPPVPPLPVSKFLRSEEEEEEEEREEDIRMEYDTMSLTSPSPIRETDFDGKHKSAPHLQERITEESQPRPQLRSGLLSDEPLRISSLEVGDLKVDRLSVSQIEAHKIVASEVDAMMITASEVRSGGSTEDSFSPAIIRELMAIRSHLETVTSQAQERQRERETASRKATDIPTTDGKQISEQQRAEEQSTAELQLAQQKSTESQTGQHLLSYSQFAQQLLEELPSAQQQSAELQFTQQQPAESQSAEQQPAESQPEEQTESQPEEQQQPVESQQIPAELQAAQQLLVDLQLAQQLLAELQSVPQQTAESQSAEEQEPAAEQRPSAEQPVESTREATESSSEIAVTDDDGQTTEAGEDEQVVKTDVIDVKNKETPHTPSLAQTKESLLPIDDLELSKDTTNETTTHLLPVAQDTQDKDSLRILDSEHPLTLSTTSGISHAAESRASYPPSEDVPSATQLSESRVSPERVAESPSSCVVQTTATSTTTTTITTATTATTTTEPDATSTDLRGGEDSASSKEQICRESRSSSPGKSRSRSPSPKGIVRQTASPVRSLPPVISVTPDTPDDSMTVLSGRGAPTKAQPQRAVISYSSDTQQSVPKTAQTPQRAVISSTDSEQSLRDRRREFSQSPDTISSPFPLSATHFIAIPASEIPAGFFALSETPTSQHHVDSEPGVIDTTQQLLRALRLTGIKAMRHFVRYLTSAISADDTREKVREVELAICALLLLIAGLLIYYFSRTQTVTHLHHWDYFNPPQ